MTVKKTDKNRRKFVTVLGASTVAIPVSALIGSLPSHAAEMVDEASDGAKNWEYVATSTNAEQNCMGCALFQGEAGAEGGPCPLFPGEHVAATGWCKAWAPKPS